MKMKIVMCDGIPTKLYRTTDIFVSFSVKPYDDERIEIALGFPKPRPQIASSKDLRELANTFNKIAKTMEGHYK